MAALKLSIHTLKPSPLTLSFSIHTLPLVRQAASLVLWMVGIALQAFKLSIQTLSFSIHTLPFALGGASLARHTLSFSIHSVTFVRNFEKLKG